MIPSVPACFFRPLNFRLMADAVAAKLPFAFPFPLDDNHPQNWMVDQLVRK